MRIGLYGGTFDPVHRGHVHAAQSAAEALNLDQVRMVLAARPRHREAPQASIEHRWQMLSLACAETTNLVADDCEIRRAGPSYAVDTLADYRRRYPASQLFWIAGEDSFASLTQWHQWQRIIKMCQFVILSRPLGAQPPVHKQCHRELSMARVIPLTLPMLELSATQLRQALAQGDDATDGLAGPVHDYIVRCQLYHTTENTV